MTRKWQEGWTERHSQENRNDETLQEEAKSRKDMYAWTRHPFAVISLVMATLAQFIQITWFAATLSKRVDTLETDFTYLQSRYQQEVIPRQDLSNRLERLEKSIDRSTELIIEHDARSVLTGKRGK